MRYKEIISESYYERMSSDDLAQIAHEMSGAESGEMLPQDAEWHYDPHFPLSKLLGLMDGKDGWKEWFRDELKTNRDEQLHRDWPVLHKEEIHEPIVVGFLPNGTPEIWDGWHRTAGQIVKGATTIPAIVGVAKTHESNLQEDASPNVFYHGTSKENARYIERHGFNTESRLGGITKGGSPSETRFFTCLTPSARTAKWYAFNGSDREDGGAVITTKYPAKIFNVDGYKGMRGWVDIYKAFAVAGEEFGIPKIGIELNMNGIAAALLKNGYNAVAFKDTWSDGRAALVALQPEKIDFVKAVPAEDINT